MSSKRRIGSGFALRFIVLMLVVSGLVRLGSVGVAVARSSEDAINFPVDDPQNCGPDSNLNELFEIVDQRTKQLDLQEFEFAKRKKELEIAEQLIQQNLVRLELAEQKLADTIDVVDGASEDDISRLTAVYETMKPQTASELFSQMTPEFAAGFLGRMSPKAAGDIMSGLSAENAYAISVVLAGRNANVPTE